MPICGQISALFQLKIEPKLLVMMNYISDLHFGEKSVKISPKIEKLQNKKNEMINSLFFWPDFHL